LRGKSIKKKSGDKQNKLNASACGRRSEERRWKKDWAVSGAPLEKRLGCFRGAAGKKIGLFPGRRWKKIGLFPERRWKKDWPFPERRWKKIRLFPERRWKKDWAVSGAPLEKRLRFCLELKKSCAVAGTPPESLRLLRAPPSDENLCAVSGAPRVRLAKE